MRLLGANLTLPLFVFLLAILLACSHGQNQGIKGTSDNGLPKKGNISEQTSQVPFIPSQQHPNVNQTTAVQLNQEHQSNGHPNQNQSSESKTNRVVTEHSNTTQEPPTQDQPNQGRQNQGQQNQVQQNQGQQTQGQQNHGQQNQGQQNQGQQSQGQQNQGQQNQGQQNQGQQNQGQQNQGQQTQGQQNQGQQNQGQQTQAGKNPGQQGQSSQGGNPNAGRPQAAMQDMPLTPGKPLSKRDDDNILARALRAPNPQEAGRILADGAATLKDILPSSLRKLPAPADNATVLDTIMAFLSHHYADLKPEMREAIFSWFRTATRGGSQGSGPRDKSAQPEPWLNTTILLCMRRFMAQVTSSDLREIVPEQICEFLENNLGVEILGNLTDLQPLLARILLDKLDSCRDRWVPRAFLQRLGQLTCFFGGANITWAKNNNVTDQLLANLQQCATQRDKLYQMVARTYGTGARLDAVAITKLGKAMQLVSVTRLLDMGSTVVRDAIGELGSMDAWPRGKAKLLVTKYLASGKNISSAADLRQLGSLVAGIDANTLRQIPTKELLNVTEELSLQAEHMRPSQQKAIVSKIIEEVNISRALDYLKGSLVSAISLVRLRNIANITNKTFENKLWNKGQALFLLKKLLKDGQSISSADIKTMASASSGLTCGMLNQLDNSTLLHCSGSLASRRDLMSRAQLKCLAQRVFSWLNTTRSNYFSNISSEELSQVAPNLLIQLPFGELKKIPMALCGNLTQQLGRADVHILAKRTPLREDIISVAKTCWNSSLAPTVEEVELMGQLVCMLPASYILAMPDEAFALAVEQFKLCLQLNGTQKDAVAVKMRQAFGAPSNWSEDTIIKLGVLLATLSAENIASINSTAAVAEALQSILANPPTINDTQPDFNSTLDLTALARKYYDSTTTSLASRSRRSIVCPSSETIANLQEANSQWQSEILACITNQTFIESVEVLGSVKGFKSDQLEALKKKSFTAWGVLSNWTAEQFSSLGYIALNFTPTELSALSIGIAETVTAFASFPEWRPSKALVEEFLKQYPPANLKEDELAGKGNLICGFSEAQIQEIPKAVFSTVVASLGGAFCSDRIVLRALKEKAVEALGFVSTWTESTLHEVGNIAGGLTPAELSNLNSSLLSYIKPSAVPLLSLDAFKALSPQQLFAFGADNSASSTEEQRGALSPEQRSVLLRVINNIEPKSLPSGVNSAGASGVDARVAVASLIVLKIVLLAAVA
uniref:Otoancorin-like n=1 Tax=Petromyzon marinus TaxID=7757 RepID=A0AAJ7UIK8_PETMA|nr:otoancorin-like [Petromyzon marinus]